MRGCSFLSLRGYTVIRRFCGYDEMEKDDRIFDYFAAGWNRDGLALRSTGQLMEDILSAGITPVRASRSSSLFPPPY